MCIRDRLLSADITGFVPLFVITNSLPKPLFVSIVNTPLVESVLFISTSPTVKFVPSKVKFEDAPNCPLLLN